MRSVVVATSTGLYKVTGETQSYYPEVAHGVATLFDEPVAVLAPCARPGTLAAIGITDDWRQLWLNHGRIGQTRIVGPVLEHRPTCLVDAHSSMLHQLVGTTGAHLYGLFDRTEEEWDAWDDAHPAADQGHAPFDRVASFDELPDRVGWTQPWGAPPDVRSMAVPSPIGNRYPMGLVVPVLVNPHVGGVMRSDDEGVTWRQLLNPAVDVHQVVTCAPGLIAVATGAAGCGISRDGGETWHFSTAGMHAGYCRAVTLAGDTILVSASSGPHASDGALYRRRLDDDDAGFRRVTDGLPTSFGDNVDTHHLASRWSGEDVALVAPGGEVFVSHDAGDTWASLGVVPGTPRQLVVT